MANNKSGAKRRTSNSKSAYKKGKTASKNNTVQDEVLVVLVVAFSVLLLFSTFGLLGKVGKAVGSVLFGLMGIVAFIFPFFIAFMLLFMINRSDIKRVQIRSGAGGVLLAMLCAISQLTFGRNIIIPFGKNIGYYYTAGVENHKSGGFIGGIISHFLTKFLGTFGAWIVVLALAIIAAVLFTEMSVASTAKNIGRRAVETNKRNREYRSRRAEIYEKERQGRMEQAKLREEEREIARQKRLTEQEKKREAALIARSERAEAARIAREENAQRLRDEQRALYLKQQADEQLKQKAERERKEAEEALAVSHGFANDIEAGSADISEQDDNGSKKSRILEGPVYDREPELMIFSGKTPEKRRIDNRVSGVMTATKLFDMGDSNGDIREITINPEDAVFDFDERIISTKHSINIAAIEDEKEIKEAYERDLYIEDSEDISSHYKDVTDIKVSDIDDNIKTPSAFDRTSSFRQSVYVEKDTDDLVAEVIDDIIEKPAYEPEPVRVSQPVKTASAIDNIDNYVVEDTYLKPETEEYKAAMKAPVEKVIKAKPAPKRAIKYKLPPVNLLSEVVKKAESSSKNELNETAQKLKETFETFGVNVTVLGALRGPSVTRYEIQPETGVKVSKVVSLTDDIKLALAATDIRMEAPIPGKSAIGIEVPNKENSAVQYREIVESRTFKESKSKISFGVGKDLNGQAVVTDIAKMPHVLIAGATGSGKSVCINTLIMSILYKATPDEVRLIMIDPKVVELSVYNGIPHLLLPVVTDPKKASASLQWAVNEMMRRYQCFADLQVKDMAGYNKMLADNPAEYAGSEVHKHMPQIVIIVDELADLMMVAAKEVEESICRLAQLARAAGIHLVLATQRPSVDVITGLIKANMPSRIAFSVSSGVDSRTILDMVGAEKLLGKGDMLFFPQNFTKPARVQGAFVSDDEVRNVVDFLKSQVVDSPYDEAAKNAVENGGGSTGGKASGGFSAPEQNDRFDELFYEAGRSIIDKQKASIGMLQRFHKIGFNRAARIMDQLADAGVVGPEEGTKPRNVLMTMEEFEQYIQENNQ